MLKIENLSSGYGNREILHGISLKFVKGKIYAILGPNGSGKSTLLKTIDRVIKPRAGTVYLSEEDFRKISSRNLAKKIAYLPQNSNSVPYSTVFDAILLGRKPHISFEPTRKDLEIVERIINNLELNQYAFRKINELSGGEAQKVLIARALAQESEVLLLDEPVNHFDPKNQIEILKFLKKITIELNLVTIIVMHDLNLAIQFGDYFIFMKNGKVYREGDLNIINEDLIKEIFEIDVKIFQLNGRKFVING
ncbi:ABC transporter ATP-binding protein [Thermodesulfovibrio hydrogeniphilus]